MLLYRFEDFALDTERRELRCRDDLLPIEPQVFDLLTYLIDNRKRVVSKDDLIASVWAGRIVSDATLDSRVNAARRAIGDSGGTQRLIKTLPRKGIRFVGAVRENEKPPEGVEHSPTVALPLPERPSIAVLPFVNMSGDPEQEYFVDGMAEEIITALARCNWLFVIARNSSFTYKSKAVDVRQIGRELGVRYVLEGSVRRAGDRLRFTGQLIDATSGTHIWADRFDGEMSDVFELQDRFTASVVAAIEPVLQLAEIERLKHKPAASLDAYDLLLRAQQRAYEFTAESLAAALRYLEQALAIDPSYAPAMALAACCYGDLYRQGWARDPAAEAAEGLRLAARAVEIAKDDSNVLWMAAFGVWCLAQDGFRARDLAYRSLRLNPNSPMALTIAGWVESILANHDKAFELIGRAQRLSPRDPREWFMSTAMAGALMHNRQFQEALPWAENALAQNPRNSIARRILASCLASLGQIDKAREIMREVLKIEPDLTISTLRGRLTHMEESVWKTFSNGLRCAGLPE
jgi:TolB-like protein/Tfp pilus assembly protein PilF